MRLLVAVREYCCCVERRAGLNLGGQRLETDISLPALLFVTRLAPCCHVLETPNAFLLHGEPFAAAPVDSTSTAAVCPYYG